MPRNTQFEADRSAAAGQRDASQPVFEVPCIRCRTGGVGFGGGVAVQVVGFLHRSVRLSSPVGSFKISGFPLT